MKKKAITPKPSNLAQKHAPSNLLLQTMAAQRRSRASYLVQDGLASYTGLIIDIVIQSVEELYNEYNKSPLAARDANLKTYLQDCYDAAQESYNFFNGIAKDKQFFLDLRDGAQRYFTPIFNEVFEGFEVIYRCTGVRHYKMSAMIALIWGMIGIGRASADGLLDAVARHSKVSFSGEGLEHYRLVKLFDTFAKTMDKYVPRYPDVLQPSIDALLRRLAEALHQSKFCVAAGRYAVKYNPDFLNYFTNICRNAYGVKFTMQ